MKLTRWVNLPKAASCGDKNTALVNDQGRRRFYGDSWEYTQELKRAKDDLGNNEVTLQKIRDDFPYVTKP